jgi:hypothetical protein
MASITSLSFDNSYARLSPEFYEVVDPTPLPELTLVAFNPDAASLIENGWQLKPLQRAIVLSRTYRQASDANLGDALQGDPENRLLAHFPRRRLSADRVSFETRGNVAAIFDATRGTTPILVSDPLHLLRDDGVGVGIDAGVDPVSELVFGLRGKGYAHRMSPPVPA